ncbi:MAG: purine-nucleoside phosphorylase [Vicinamibacterales bacterium]
MDYYAQVLEATNAVRSRLGGRTPQVAIVLGSGLGDFAGTLADPVSIPYADLPHWPVSRVVGHEGRLVVGDVRGRTVAALAGRCHLYEGHDARTVTFATRVLGVLGVKALVLTNAAGGINVGFAQGALMVIDDHINLTGSNPLTGANEDRFGVRFPDMSTVYAPRLRQIANEAARSTGTELMHGVYAALLGPSYETPAEIRYLRAIGADAVGMSTAPEAIVARHMGIEVLGISCITNMAAGVLPDPLDHNEVMATARKVRGQFIALLEAIVERL